MIGVVLVDGHRGGEIGLADFLHLDLPAFAQYDPRGLGLAGEPGHELHGRAGEDGDVRRVLHCFRREAGEGGETLRLIDAFDVRQVGDRELEDLGLDAVRLDPVFRVFLNVENEELELVVVFGRLHHLADPLSVIRAGLAGEDRRLFGAEVEQLGENLLVGAFRDARRAGFDFEFQGVGRGDVARRRYDLRDAHRDLFRAEYQRGDEQRQARGGGPSELPEALTRDDLVDADGDRAAVGVFNQAVNYHGRKCRAHLFAGKLDRAYEAVFNAWMFLFEQAGELGVARAAAQRADQGEVDGGDHAQGREDAQ
jgi:hypothetical protein